MEETPTPDLPRSNRKAGLIGGVVGSIGLAASIFALTATAGAAGPVLQAQDGSSDSEPAPVLDEDFPDEEAWAEYDACVDAVFEAHGFDVDEAFADVEMLDMDDYEGDFDEFDFEIEFGPAVSIMNGEDMSFAEFGEGDGSIMITKTGDDISVTSDGDVVVEEIDWDELEAEGIGVLEGEVLEGDIEMLDDFDHEAFEEIEEALSTCDDQLPEGVDLDVEFGAIEDFDFDQAEDVDEADEAELTEAS